jgi:hypothetical protein
VRQCLTEREKEAMLVPERKKEEVIPTPAHAPVPERKKATVTRVSATTRLGFPSSATLEGGSGGCDHDTAVTAG